jgi:hypothetical protein
VSSPDSGGSDTSWIWRSLDGGRTFKWIPAAAPRNRKVTACPGGGDTELAVDPAGRLYFNDLSLANFSVARSDDHGVTFTPFAEGQKERSPDYIEALRDRDAVNERFSELQAGIQKEILVTRTPHSADASTRSSRCGATRRSTPPATAASSRGNGSKSGGPSLEARPAASLLAHLTVDA